ncbi:hypothetical protein [Singulisphaera sp. PoT]|uniref:hypothetical protein n=1 Tax=Singulisphaera sp. PoT TaxID=3411797 RepID=UPI003BF51D99
MTIMTRTRPMVKPTRRSPRIDAPFAEGLEERGLCCPIDRRPLPTIDGVGLEAGELARLGRARTRAMAAYAKDCPFADRAEVECVGKKAATDELRRLLMERPAAPELVTPEPEVEAVPMGTATGEIPQLPRRLRKFRSRLPSDNRYQMRQSAQG